MEPTADPAVRITERRASYVRYVSDEGREWEVHGDCDHRGDCLVGAVVDGENVTTLARALALASAYSGLDVPVGPGFSGCCPLRVVAL